MSTNTLKTGQSPLKKKATEKGLHYIQGVVQKILSVCVQM